MGAIWLLHLPWWIQDGGLEVDTWRGWETRSRSSGGYDAIHAIGVHHTAGAGTLDNNARYCWDNASARPIGAILLDPQGRVRVGAAGATNTQGRGGPLNTSKGITPKDAGNRYWVSIEAINRGDGSPWPEAQQEAYVRLCRILCNKLNLDPTTDVLAHFEWTTRKVDPAGSSRYAVGTKKWNMSTFRSDVRGATTPPQPPPSGYNPPTDWGLFPLDTNKPWVGRGSYGEVSSGPHVLYVQDVIFHKAGGNIVRDGQFGPQTEGRVRDVQRTFGLRESGSVNHGGAYADDTWAALDSLTGAVKPPEPPPSGDVTVVEPCMVWVMPGDSPWTATDRLFGDGSKWATYFTQDQFNRANYYAKVKTTRGKKTAVKSGEGVYAILDRMQIDRGRLDEFYDWNGGKGRTLHPGDVVYMPL